MEIIKNMKAKFIKDILFEFVNSEEDAWADREIDKHFNPEEPKEENDKSIINLLSSLPHIEINLQHENPKKLADLINDLEIYNIEFETKDRIFYFTNPLQFLNVMGILRKYDISPLSGE